jgi:2-iminobutanoate/2-iminopropanoate deaminase
VFLIQGLIMATKQAFDNKNLPNMKSIFSWGLKLSDFNDVFFVTGHTDCDPNFVTRFPGDPVAQTKVILSQMNDMIEEAGFSVHDIVRTDWTFVKEVNSDQFSGIAAAWQDYLKDVEVKPATGTLRYVERLGAPDVMVEYEMMLAK